ncbi:chemosensory receptor a [Plakobranchus ocellatus]|uniref:Chemosensory receptor a n=1 Tax=Plakobranchus ocellatus TaxID=259542 RepID=A0AAV4BWF0_9GAST|nr:chemosensory receptor a [Plakobranchus ocellatus]
MSTLMNDILTQDGRDQDQVESTTPYYYDFLDERKRKIAEIVMDYVISFCIALVGVVTNTLVISVYTRQGFRESVAVSMTIIAIWDLVKSLGGVMERLSGILSLWNPATALSWSNICVVVFNYLISFSTYVTSVMAAYVAIERCLCVSIPLKVKWLLTPRVTLTAGIIISAVVFGCFAVMFGIYDIRWEWSAEFNATVAVYKKNRFYVNNEEPLFQYYNLSGILWPLASFVVIIVATIIITYKLHQGSKFRAGQSNIGVIYQSGTQNQGNVNASHKQVNQQANVSRRDRQVVKMLLVIIAIYIVSLSPRIALYIGKYIVHDFYFLRRHHHLFNFILYWIWIADFTNGAVNFFVIYSMSSSFRSTFIAMFSCSRNSSSSK